jgi:hypothetical protein
MLSATVSDALIAAIIILAMSFGLIVPKMAIDYISDRVAPPLRSGSSRPGSSSS